MGKRKDLSEFDKRQIVMARRLDQSISKTAALVGCSRSAVPRQTLSDRLLSGLTAARESWNGFWPVRMGFGLHVSLLVG
ncbi:hypothetical protein DPX16_1458 [Anabarilius grahami]|uniref:Uncharacterized protein n=1 Tax=Anabarilius grahami TaxID=495550 RepID=A0A3N0YLQ6_ANAGA|nr:hypothetical protein DPX16_1458 [Anabarilius grahami]